MATMLMSTGCSSDEVVNDYSPENAIQFGTYVGRDASARASATTTESLQNSGNGFGVFANYTTNNVALNPNFMNNQQVTYVSGAWTYSPVKYWPNNDTDQVTFWAYAPWNTNNTNTSATAPHFVISDGTDYVASDLVTKKKSTVDDVDDKVLLTFHHMMSKVGFKVEAIVDEIEAGTNSSVDETSDATDKTITSGTQIVVTGVSLAGNLVTSGTYTYGDVAGSDPVRQDWCLGCDAAVSTTHSLEASQFKNPVTYTYGTLSQSIYGKSVGTANPTSQLNDDDEYLMLVPQTATINITVNYSVITEDANLAGGYSKVDNSITSGDFAFIFERGKAYNFVLHLGLTSVKFDATVKTWAEDDLDSSDDDRIVNVPLNFTNND